MLDALKTLLRVAIEISHRLSCIHDYADNISSAGSHDEYKPLVISINQATEALNSKLGEVLSNLQQSILRRSSSGISELEPLIVQLRTHSKWFVSLHELLVYLPRLHARNEAIIMLREAFGTSYETQSPSVILGTIFNAFEFDFMEEMTRKMPELKDIQVNLQEKKRTVLQLPVCDVNTPHSWSVLGHEMGHAINDENNIAKKAISKFIKSRNSTVSGTVENWSSELAADIISAQALGPISILALLSMAYCSFPSPRMHIETEKHPRLHWRLRIVSEFLEQKYQQNFLSDEYQAFQKSEDYWNARQNTGSSAISAAEKTFKDLVRPISHEIINEVAKLTTNTHDLNQSSIDRCIGRLNNQTPISSQGEARLELREEIDRYKNNASSLAKDQRVDAFKELSRKFEEDPLSIQTILISGYLARLQQINVQLEGDSVETLDVMSDPNSIRSICKQLSTIDELTASSIDGSWIHSSLRRKQGVANSNA